MGAMLGVEISEKINALLSEKSNIKLLEAGCGSSSYLKFVPIVHSVGIDISQEQLDQNKVIQEKIQGDLEKYPLSKEEFDVVVCWDVLEHLSTPRDALTNIFKATKPQGFVILGFPNLASLKGMVTKFTPFWFHKFFYRFIMKYDSAPCKTYFRVTILPKNVIRFAEANGFFVEYYRLVEGAVTKKARERLWPLTVLFLLLNICARIVSLGNCQSLYLDSCALILKKREAARMRHSG